jgi:hypothetical protein
MTSNLIEHLDHALIRPGRIDVIANFKKCLNTTVLEMIEFFYEVKLSPSEKARIFNLQEYVISPAELGKLMFEHLEDYRVVLDLLEKPVQYPDLLPIVSILSKHKKEERSRELASLGITMDLLGKILVDHLEFFQEALQSEKMKMKMKVKMETETETTKMDEIPVQVLPVADEPEVYAFQLEYRDYEPYDSDIQPYTINYEDQEPF